MQWPSHSSMARSVAMAAQVWCHSTSAMACNACRAPEFFILHTSANFKKSNTQIFSNKDFFSHQLIVCCKWIPISNSLGEETALVNVSISKGHLNCQRLMLSDMPNWRDKIICRYTGCTLQTFWKRFVVHGELVAYLCKFLKPKSILTLQKN